MNIKNNILETIGNTPLVKINKLTKGKIFAKLEKFNPAGSIKDRPALNMIEDARDKLNANVYVSLVFELLLDTMREKADSGIMQ